MFGKTNLLSCGYRTAAMAQFEAELAQAREERAARRGWRLATLAGIAGGIIGAALAYLGVLPL